MGTTGLDDEQKGLLEDLGRLVPIVWASNMSVGMNVLFSMAPKLAQVLGPDYDVEIVEAHHRFKKDAPSGSAMTLAQRLCQATNAPLPDALFHGRQGRDAQRKPGTIGLHAVRAGDITGIHTVIFGGIGETITITHTAHNRDTFVLGALRAARWVVNKPPGLYSMQDVLGLEL
jgi:4-hydroxy-tetrahydrodipicolinate reductase